MARIPRSAIISILFIIVSGQSLIHADFKFVPFASSYLKKMRFKGVRLEGIRDDASPSKTGCFIAWYIPDIPFYYYHSLLFDASTKTITSQSSHHVYHVLITCKNVHLLKAFCLQSKKETVCQKFQKLKDHKFYQR